MLAAGLIATALAQHDNHQHSDDSVADCSCITGIDTEELDISCDDTSTLESIQSYLENNDCIGYCHAHGGMTMFHLDDDDAAESFTCFQAFSLLVQYHDYCPTGSFNVELFYELLEECPDCKQEHYYQEGAPECSGMLDCDDTEDQESIVTYVSENCVDSCEGNCTEVWQMVEGYRRMCAHGELSTEFEVIFDSAIEATLANGCGEDIYCNVPWEANYTADCTSDANSEYAGYLDDYGELDVDAITTGESGVRRVVIGLALILSAAAVFFV